MQTQLPPAPDALAPAPAPAPNRGGLKAAAAAVLVVGALVVGGLVSRANTSTEPVTPSTPVEVTGPSDALIAQSVADTMSPADLAQFCEAYAVLGDATGFRYFAEGFTGEGGGTMADARLVYDALKAKC